jgi:protein FAM50
MKAKQENIVQAREREIAKNKEEQLKEKRRQEKAKEREKNKQKAQIQALSFDPDADLEDDDEEAEADVSDANSNPGTRSRSKSQSISPSASPEPPPLKKCRGLGKDPAVDTSFLPDKNREEEEDRLREQLRQEWVMKQEEVKKEEIEITFSYWDGSGHRNSVKMKKGQTIYQFLQKCLEMLRKQFPELRTVSADQLMYVKEDLIIPHHYSFYDFIVTKVSKNHEALVPISLIF